MTATLPQAVDLTPARARWGVLMRTVLDPVPVAMLLSLVILAPLLWFAGVDVEEGYRTLVDASFGSPRALESLLVSSTPLLVTAVAVTIAYRAGMFNVGGDGQIVVGALLAVWLVQHLGTPPLIVGVVVLLVVGGVGGAAWAAVAGALRRWRAVNEIISTIMLNVVALLVAQYLVSGPLKADGLQYAATEQVPPIFWLRSVALGPFVLPVGFFISVAVLLCVAAFCHQSSWGWRQRLVGLGAEMAARQRVRVAHLQFNSLMISGALAGAAGVLELLGNQHRVGYSFSPGWGFNALAVVLLAQGRFLAALPLALYVGMLLNASPDLQTQLGLSGNFVYLLVGLPVVVTAALMGFLAGSWRPTRARTSAHMTEED